MKQTKLALSAIMIVAVGLVGANFVTGSEMTEQEINAYLDSTPIYGHLTIIHADPEGNILTYIQTDNLVASTGKDCISELAFGASDSTCEGTASIFNQITLFDAKSFPTTMNVTSLLASDIGGSDGLQIATGTVNEATASTDNGYSAAGATTTTIANTFVAGSAVSNQNVDGAALIAANSLSVFAGQVFSAPVTLNNADTLAVTWSIALG